MKMMKATAAIKFMAETGKTVEIFPRGTGYDVGYYKLFRNDVILMLIPGTSCAAMTWNRFTLEEFAALGKYYEFREHSE